LALSSASASGRTRTTGAFIGGKSPTAGSVA
jgi:hypothetical protein